MPPALDIAARAWNMMGGAIDSNLLPIVAELLGADDIELLFRQLLTIREFHRGRHRH